MPFGDVLGQEPAVETIRRGLARGRLHHALLFVGPDGVGKELTAFALAQAMVCTAASSPGNLPGQGGDGCGQCSSCHRAKTFSGDARPGVPLHPDVVLVERGLYPKEVLGRTTDEKTDISVDQVRRVILERVSFAPHEARERIVIVRRAEEMSAGAANALLKTLEEPPAHTRFVLLTARPGDLLPTIRSRSLPVRFAPLPEEIVVRILVAGGVEPERARAAAALSGGSVEVARVLADPDASRDRTAAVSSLQKAARGTLAELLAATAEYGNSGEDRVRLREHLIALTATEAESIRSMVLRGDDARELDAALLRCEAAAKVAEALEHNANVPLALEAAWLHLSRGHG